MPRTKSAKKHLRQSEKRTLQNRAVKSAAKTQMKKVISAVAERDSERANAELKTAYKKLDQAAAKRAIPKNTASRHKSRLAKKVSGVAKSSS